ncbi:YqaE/Pmp3 family membrane protein [Vibrio sp. M60_M31a]
MYLSSTCRGVSWKRGFNKDFFINLIPTFFFFLPGTIHALLVDDEKSNLSRFHNRRKVKNGMKCEVNSSIILSPKRKRLLTMPVLRLGSNQTTFSMVGAINDNTDYYSS